MSNYTENKLIKGLDELLRNMKPDDRLAIYDPITDHTYQIPGSRIVTSELVKEEMYYVYHYPANTSATTPYYITDTYVMVYYQGGLYRLVYQGRPYGSTDLMNELSMGHWELISGGAAADPQYLDDLVDVNTTGALAGRVLYRNATEWIAKQLVASDIGALDQATADTLYQAIGNYEPTFSKNTAFNKNFGTTSGTVSEGNHTHTLDDLSDVSTVGAANGMALVKTATGYQFQAISGGSTGLTKIEADGYYSPLAHTHPYIPLTLAADTGVNTGQYELLFESGIYSANQHTSTLSIRKESAGLSNWSYNAGQYTAQHNGYISGTQDNIDFHGKTYWIQGPGGRATLDFKANSQRSWIEYQGVELNTGGTGGGATTLAALTDTTITSPANGNILQYNGSAWVNASLGSAYVKTSQTASQTIDYSPGTKLVFRSLNDAYTTLSGGMTTKMYLDWGAGGMVQTLDGTLNGTHSWLGHVGTLQSVSGSNTLNLGHRIRFYDDAGRIAMHEVMMAGTQAGFVRTTVDSQVMELRDTGLTLNSKRILTVDDLAGGGSNIGTVTLTDAATVNMDLSLSHNFKWAISAGNKTLIPMGTGFVDGTNWSVKITGCAGQTLFLGPTTGFTHYLSGTNGAVTGVVLPASGIAVVSGHRFENEIYWTLADF